MGRNSIPGPQVQAVVDGRPGIPSSEDAGAKMRCLQHSRPGEEEGSNSEQTVKVQAVEFVFAHLGSGSKGERHSGAAEADRIDSGVRTGRRNLGVPRADQLQLPSLGETKAEILFVSPPCVSFSRVPPP